MTRVYYDTTGVQAVPDLIREGEQHGRLQLFDTDWTSRVMRPETVLAALMQQAPGEPLSESVEELLPLHLAVEHAARNLTAEDVFVLNAISSEEITFDELALRLGVGRTQAWRLYQRSLKRVRMLLLNYPPVRERLGMAPSWNAAAMCELTAIASYENDWPAGTPDYSSSFAAADIARSVASAVTAMNDYREFGAMGYLSNAAEYAVAYLRSVGKWNLTAMHELLVSKQNDYGHGNILKFGMTGVVVRASDKAERLLNLTSGTGVAARNESLLDSFFDTIGYAVIARMLKAETFELALDTETDSDFVRANSGFVRERESAA